MIKYIKESFAELNNVTWPTRKQGIKITTIVIVFMIISAILFLFLLLTLSLTRNYNLWYLLIIQTIDFCNFSNKKSEQTGRLYYGCFVFLLEKIKQSKPLGVAWFIR